MKVAILGLGSIGTRHARNFRELGIADFVGMDPDPVRRSNFAAEAGAKSVATIDEVLGEAPQLAIVASPNRYHVSQALACARAGIHLLIEKPLSHSQEDVAELLSEVRKRSLFAHVGSNWKFHPAFRAMKKLLDDGEVGRVLGAQVLAGQWLPDWHPWEDYRRGYSARLDLGGGVIFDTHELDYLTWLLGPVSQLKGFCKRTGAIETETEDIAAACLLFQSGAVATLQIDYLQREPRRRYHLNCTEGTIEWDLQAACVSFYRSKDRQTEVFTSPNYDLNQMYVEQSRHVLTAIHDGLPPLTPLDHAAAVLALQLAWKQQAAG